MKSSSPRRRSGEGRRGDGRFRDAGKRVRNDVRSHYHNRKDWFNRRFWDRHHYRPPYYNYNTDWWLPATTVGIGTWLGWQDQPYYYSTYDEFGYASYPSDYADIYYVQPDQTQVQIVLSDEESSEWMPLGVFSVQTTTQTTPSMFIQLALRKNGEIAGTYYNAILDQNYELEGMVNAETQLAAWKISNNPDSPVFQTGIYNLAEDEVPIRVYFQTSTTQDWLLIRLEE